jgi:hypothetical protein
MIKHVTFAIAALVVSGLAIGQESEPAAAEPQADQEPSVTAAPQASEAGEVKSLLGISILGNEEAPKSLVIVPWKSSEIGGGIGVDQVLDDRPVPVDKEVFMRELRFYQIRSNDAE